MISAREQTLLKRGWHNICGSSNILVRTSAITILIIAVRFIEKYLKDKKKCEEGNIKCNMENLPIGHIIHSNQISIWNVNIKYHTTTDHTRATWRFILWKIHITVPCVQKHPSPGATWKVMLEKIWILMHYVEGKSYQGTTQRDPVKALLSRIFITVLCVAKDLYPGTTQTDTWRVLLNRINISVWPQNC